MNFMYSSKVSLKLFFLPLSWEDFISIMIILAETARPFSYSETEVIIALTSVFKIYFCCYCISDLFFCLFFFFLNVQFYKEKRIWLNRTYKVRKSRNNKKSLWFRIKSNKGIRTYSPRFFFKKIRFPAVRLTIVNNRRSHFNKDRH